MLGISVYFQDFDEAYIRQAAKMGISYVMTSLQIPEEDNAQIEEKLPYFMNLLKELNMTLIPDVSAVTFQKLGMQPGDFKALKAKGMQLIRLDYGFDDVQVLKTLSQNFKLVLNASIVQEDLLKQMQVSGIDFNRILSMHNYYPRKDTGLDRDSFQKKNQLLHRYGIRVQAFVSGDALKRFPLYEGLPTLECHREKHPLYAMLDLLKNCDVDDVFIGDSKANPTTLKVMASYMNDRLVMLPAFLEKDYQHFYQIPLKCRHESSPSVLRIMTPRQKGIAPYQNNKRQCGSITIDNVLMGRYCGEMQIVKEDKAADARCNVIGFVHPAYRDVLDLIDGTNTIELIQIE